MPMELTLPDVIGLLDGQPYGEGGVGIPDEPEETE